jgi:hypothetical protein
MPQTSPTSVRHFFTASLSATLLVGCMSAEVSELIPSDLEEGYTHEQALTVPPTGSGLSYLGNFQIKNENGLCMQATNDTNGVIMASCDSRGSQAFALYPKLDGMYHICLPESLYTNYLVTETYWDGSTAQISKTIVSFR